MFKIQVKLGSSIKKEYDEITISNLLAYIFEQNKAVFTEFAKDVLGIDGFDVEFDIYRETRYRVDIWIESKDGIIVIENKIKSKINGERYDVSGDQIKSQLDDYYKHAISDSNGRNVHCYIFLPDYNSIKLNKYASGKYYVPIHYSQIYDFYLKHAGEMLHTDYFREFVDALAIHTKTVDNSNFDVMRERFIAKIRKIIDSKNI